LLKTGQSTDQWAKDVDITRRSPDADVPKFTEKDLEALQSMSAITGYINEPRPPKQQDELDDLMVDGSVVLYLQTFWQKNSLMLLQELCGKNRPPTLLASTYSLHSPCTCKFSPNILTLMKT
jgi:hypothetical protein